MNRRLIRTAVLWKIWAAFTIVTSFACGCSVAAPATQTTQEIAYSFTNETGGGIAAVQIDVVHGKLVDSKIVLHDSQCHQPLKVRRSENGHYLLVTDPSDGPHLFIQRKGFDNHASVMLPSEPDEVRIVDDQAWASCEDDQLVVVDLRDAAIERILQVDETFQPRANAPESITVVDGDGEQYIVVSFQKDSKTGKKKGNRLAIYRQSDRQRIADLPLRRDHPELHIEDNEKQQGPGPEIVFVKPDLNTLLVTLDLYGAVGFADWQAALDGRLSRWSIVSTAPDGSLGTAFPDRGTSLTIDGRTCYLVCNAGESGGSALLDVAKRSVLWRGKTPPGLESPVYLDNLRKAFSVCSGKIKWRSDDDVEKRYEPRQGLFVFDISSQQAVRDGMLKWIDNQRYGFGITATKPHDEHPDPYLLLAVGTTAEYADELLLVDPANGMILDRTPAIGPIGRLEGK